MQFSAALGCVQPLPFISVAVGEERSRVHAVLSPCAVTGVLRAMVSARRVQLRRSNQLSVRRRVARRHPTATVAGGRSAGRMRHADRCTRRSQPCPGSHAGRPEPCFARPGKGHDKGRVEARGKNVSPKYLTPIPSRPSWGVIAGELLEHLDATMDILTRTVAPWHSASATKPIMCGRYRRGGSRWCGWTARATPCPVTGAAARQPPTRGCLTSSWSGARNG